MRFPRLVFALALIGSTAGLASAERGVSERYAFETYRERADRVTLLVDSYLASLRADEAYIPLHVAIGLVRGGPGVTVSRESFTLIDAAGNRVPAAASMEIRRDYELASFDRALMMRVRPLVVGQQFATLRRLPSDFYPDRGGIGVVQDRVNLSAFSRFQDVVYFPRPPAGLDGVLTLRLDDGGLEEPVDVHFRVLQGNTSRGF